MHMCSAAFFCRGRRPRGQSGGGGIIRCDEQRCDVNELIWKQTEPISGCSAGWFSGPDLSDTQVI